VLERPQDHGLPGSLGGDATDRHRCHGFAVAGPGNGLAGEERWSSPDGSQMPALGERSVGGMGAEWYFVPAIMPWAGRGVIGQWRRRVSIGEVLATARSQAGLTITQVSQRTCIRETIIGGIERDDFSACGGDFYARGHIRAIAHAVSADSEPLIGEYDSSHGTAQAQAAAGLPEPSAPRRLRQRHRPKWSVALLVVLAAVAGPVTYHLAASGPAGGAPAVARKPVVSVHKTARTHPAATNTRAPPAARHGSRDVVISLTAVTGACWADLATPAGATIFAGILGPGTSKTWTERRAVTLQLGNPGAVTLAVDGKSRAGLGSQPLTLRLAPGKRSPR
jgi:Helix-turn-helix domain/RodZ C-terminal domain